MTFFLLDKSQALGKGVCGERLPHDDMRLWEGVPFPRLVLDRLIPGQADPVEQGKTAWKDGGCRCLSHKDRQGHGLAEPCLGEKRRPRLDGQGPLSQLKVEVQGKT